MAENPENKEAKPDLFSPSGEALGYISLEQARVLAIRHARDNTDFYGPRYSGINLVLEVISQEDGEEYYDIRLSFRPAGRFRGEPGVEQFVIDKLGNIEYRQMLDEPTELDLPETEQESPVSQPPPTPPQPTVTAPTDAPATGPEPATPTITLPLTPDSQASTMCQTFYRPTDPRAEQQFRAWMRENPQGYVFNHFGGTNPRYNCLHRLPCRGLNRANAGVRKICCTSRTSVEQRIAELRDPGGWGECGLGCCGQYTSSTPG
ncbi:MAG: hypothetical protein J4N93_12045 [Chloroflexi bacterium]|nr:hypothetical protein [Chloroflexota bacterium]